MQFFTRSLMLTVSVLGVMTSSLALAEIQPAGTWSVQFGGNAVGDTAYSNTDSPMMGQIFRVDQYYGNDSVQFHSHISDLVIRYNAANQTVTVNGGDVDAERDIPLTQTTTSTNEAGYFGSSITPLYIQDSEAAPGCLRTLSARELVAFPESDPSAMSYVRRYFSIFDEMSPGACRDVLMRLAENIQTGTAGKAWLALNGSGALDLSNIANLRDAATNFLYTGTKK